MADKEEPTLSLSVTEQQNKEWSTQIRVSQIENGYVIKAGGKSIHFTSIAAAADAVREGLVTAKWPKPRGRK